MTLKSKSVFITGIRGFAGSHLAKYLLNHAAKVFGVVRRRADGTPLRNLEYLGIEKEIELLEGKRL